MTKDQQNQFDQKLKIALIVDSNISSKYVHDLACWAKKQGNLEVSSLIIQKKKMLFFWKTQKYSYIFKKN